MDTSIAEHIFVFRTNLNDLGQVEALAPILNSMPAIESWNVDLEDCDHILRVVGQRLDVRDVITSLHKEGFDCEELED